MDQQKKLQEKFVKGKLTLRDFQEQLHTAMKMGPIENLIQMFPGFSNMELPKSIKLVMRVLIIMHSFFVNLLLYHLTRYGYLGADASPREYLRQYDR